MKDEAIKKQEKKIKAQIKKIEKIQNNQKKCEKELNLFNSIVAGIHNYYSMATMICEDFHHIDWVSKRRIFKNLRDVLTFSNKVIKDDFVTNKYGNGKTLPYIRGKPMIPVGSISNIQPRYKGDRINYFDEKSRKTFHENLQIINLYVMEQLMLKPLYHQSVQLNDNVLSKFCGQLGNYAITGKMIFNFNNIAIIRKNIAIIRKNFQSGDKYDNILIVEKKVKELIELKGVDDFVVIERMKKGLTLDAINKINILRKENSLPLI